MGVPDWSYRAAMHVSVLGPLRVANGDGPIEVRGVKERTLLAHLVAKAGHMVPSTDLIASLWGEEPPRSAAKALQTYVLRLRNTLEPDRAGAPTLLVTDGGGYRLTLTERDIDARRFDTLVKLGQRSLRDGDPEAAEQSLTEALAMWRGPAYAGFESTLFGQAEGRRLEELRLGASEDRWAALLELRRTAVVVPELEQLLAQHPLRERSWALLVTALYQSGRQGDALQAYERARSVLAEELGIDPGPELREVQARVLAQDPALAPTPRGRSRLPVGLEPPPHPMVGRDHELDLLRGAWHRAGTGHAETVLVRGPAGAGATRLAAALASEVSRSGGTVVLLDDPATASTVVPEAAPGTAVLVVADHVTPPPVPAPSLTVVLGGPGMRPPPGAEVVELGPLDLESVSAIVHQYVGAEDVPVMAQQVLADSGGWPDRVHQASVSHARRAAVRQVETATVVADRSSAALASARAELSEGVQRLAETGHHEWSTDTDTCPWKGLESYDVEDARWFAGRERLVAELVSRLAGNRLLGVVGASGSGKSSLLRAGLLAALADDVLPGSAGWQQIVVRPGAHPMRELARQALGTRHTDVGELLSRLIRTESGVVDRRVVLVVDQFEEVWTACQDAGECAAFLDALAELASDPRSPVTVVLAVRADFVARLAEHPGLAAALTDSTVLVGSPTPAEVRRAIERPAVAVGLRLEDGLTDALVTDAGAEPGLLPLLSTALTRLWERRAGRDLTFAAYVGMGGLSGAIADLAESAFAALPAERQAVARMLLLRLAGPGEEAGVTRRRVTVGELEGLPQAGVREVVEALAGDRLLTVSDGHVEVAHEALFREWPRLRAWLSEDAAGRSVQRRLAVAASEWDAEGRDPGLLWRGPRLVAGLDVADQRPEEITPTERAFLDAGRGALEAERREADARAASTARQNRRLRVLLAGLAAVLVLALVAGLLALRSRAEAEESRVSAEAKRLAASALNEERRDLALLAAVEAVRMEPGPETYGALLTLLSRAPQVVTSHRTPNRYLRIAATADDRMVLLSENEPTIRALDAASGDVEWEVEAPAAAQVGGIVSSPTGHQAFVTSASEEVAGALLDTRDGSVEWTLRIPRLRRAVGDDFVPFFFSHAGWRSPRAIMLASASHLLTLDPRDGAVLDALAWPEPVTPDLFFLEWPDGRVSFGGVDGTRALVFDPRRPAEGFRTLRGVVMDVDPTGERLLLSTESPAGNLLRILDARTLEPLGEPLATGGFAVQARWSADGATLAVGVDSTVQVRDGRTGAELYDVPAHSGASMEVAFAGPQEQMLWSAGRDGTAVGIDLSGRRSILTSERVDAAPHTGVPASDAELAVGIRWTEGAFPGRLVDTRTGEDLFGDLPMTGLDCLCQVASVGITPDGRLALGGVEEYEDTGEEFLPVEDSGHLVVWDTTDGKVRDVVDLPWGVYGVEVTPDSETAVVQGRGGFVLLDLASMEVTDEVPLDEMPWIDTVDTVELSPDGTVAALGRGPSVVLVDVATGEVLEERTEPDETAFMAFAWSADGSELAVGGFSGRVTFLSADDLTPVAARRQVTAGFVIDLERSPDGATVASLGSEGDVRLWDPATWEPYGQPVLDDRTWGMLSFAEDGTLDVFYETGEHHAVETDPEAWVAAGCAAANRGLTEDESAVVRPGEPLRPTCEGLD